MGPERTPGEDRTRAALTLIAPGTPLRDGLERVLRGHTGALVVLGWDQSVQSLCTGGFELDVEFSATRLRELAKMDGAIVVDAASNRIVRAAVQLVPDPSISTEESGTRHRTAQRVSKAADFPVVSVSKSMNIITLWLDGRRYVLAETAAILSVANQALATLERYKVRLDEVSGTLSALEIEDLVTVRDAMVVIQRMEMVRRIASEILGYVVELGTDGRLISLQLEELMAGVDGERELVVRDYLPTVPARRGPSTCEEVLAELDQLAGSDLVDVAAVTRVIGYPVTADALDTPVSPHGYRLLAKVPRLPRTVMERLVEHFGGLQKLLAAGVEDLMEVEGIGETRARGIREGLSRLAESSILERYV